MTVEEILEAHRPYGLDCKCGAAINSDAGWAAHVAEALGLQEELRTVRSICDMADPGIDQRRWVTSWEEQQ